MPKKSKIAELASAETVGEFADQLSSYTTLTASEISTLFPKITDRVELMELLKIVGAETDDNDSGKTTLLKALALLLEPKGTVEVANQTDLLLTSPPKVKKRHEWAHLVGYLFQNPNDQIFSRTVFEEIAATARSHEDAEAALAICDLVEIRNANPFEIPLPHQRLVTLASVLAMRPPVLLLDEPTAFLDDKLCYVVLQAIRWCADAGHTVLIVSHDPSILNSLSCRKLRMRDGRFDR